MRIIIKKELIKFDSKLLGSCSSISVENWKTERVLLFVLKFG